MTYLTYLVIGVILIASIISVVQMFVGRFKPITMLIQGTGSIVVIWAIALWTSHGLPTLRPPVIIMLTGIAITFAPRIYKSYRILVNKDCYLQSGRRVRVRQ